MKIKITETQFDYIINNKVNEALNNQALSTFLEKKNDDCLRDFLFDSEKLVTMDNPASLWQSSLNEGLITTYPIKKTVEYVKKYFKLEDKQINIIKNYNDIECIQIIIPNINNNVNMVVRSLRMCGYFLAYPKLENLVENEWVVLQFEPKHQKDITNKLKKEESILYHITPLYNYKSIKHIGLSPKTKNTLFDYPDRVYFIRGSAGIKKTLMIGWALFNNNQSKGNDGNYIVLKIELKDLPKNISFYYDSNFEYGVYTPDNIHPSFLTYSPA